MVIVAADTNPGDRNYFHPYCKQLNPKLLLQENLLGNVHIYVNNIRRMMVKCI